MDKKILTITITLLLILLILTFGCINNNTVCADGTIVDGITIFKCPTIPNELVPECIITADCTNPNDICNNETCTPWENLTLTEGTIIIEATDIPNIELDLEQGAICEINYQQTQDYTIICQTDTNLGTIKIIYYNYGSTIGGITFDHELVIQYDKFNLLDTEFITSNTPSQTTNPFNTNWTNAQAMKNNDTTPQETNYNGLTNKLGFFGWFRKNQPNDGKCDDEEHFYNSPQDCPFKHSYPGAKCQVDTDKTTMKGLNGPNWKDPQYGTNETIRLRLVARYYKICQDILCTNGNKEYCGDESTHWNSRAIINPTKVICYCKDIV